MFSASRVPYGHGFSATIKNPQPYGMPLANFALSAAWGKTKTPGGFIQIHRASIIRRTVSSRRAGSTGQSESKSSWPEELRRSDDSPGSTGSGAIANVTDRLIIVGCGSGEISIITLQPDRKRPMSSAEFLRGRRVVVGDRFE